MYDKSGLDKHNKSFLNFVAEKNEESWDNAALQRNIFDASAADNLAVKLISFLKNIIVFQRI